MPHSSEPETELGLVVLTRADVGSAPAVPLPEHRDLPGTGVLGRAGERVLPDEVRFEHEVDVRAGLRCWTRGSGRPATP
jgi:hypothetical protein